jgi:hypothetical protein
MHILSIIINAIPDFQAILCYFEDRSLIILAKNQQFDYSTSMRPFTADLMHGSEACPANLPLHDAQHTTGERGRLKLNDC